MDGKKQVSPSPTSFFKLIATQEYLKTLYIPPAFSSTVSNLVNKTIVLNDRSERQWNVKVSEVNGSFAFKEGWSVFSLDHGLKVGYLLVFNYVKDLHFDVKIYDLSACERLDFPKPRKQKKRSRGRNGSPVRQEQSNALVLSKHHVPKMKSQRCKVDDSVAPQNGKESGQLMCISEHHEDPSTSIGFDQSHGADEDPLRVSNVDYGSPIFENDAIVCNKDTMFEGIFSMGAALDISELEMSGGNLGEADKTTYDKTSTLNIEENKAIMFKGEAQEYQLSKDLGTTVRDQAAITEKEPALHIGGSCDTYQTFNGISNPLDAHIENGEMKKLPLDITPKLCCSIDKLNVTGETPENFKKEPETLDELGATGLPNEIKEEMDSGMSNQDNESLFKTAPPISCVVTDDNVSLKLPEYLPLTVWVKPIFQHRKMVVFLRDPLRRLWPVLYHEQPRLLTHGWLDFSRANNIEPGDECVFEVEHDPESRYQRILAVSIVHKS